jgi:hypothetical protein
MRVHKLHVEKRKRRALETETSRNELNKINGNIFQIYVCIFVCMYICVYIYVDYMFIFRHEYLFHNIFLYWIVQFNFITQKILIHLINI